jgi:hypothetical protein
MSKKTLLASVKGSVIHFLYPDYANKVIQEFDNKTVVISIDEYKSKRSLRQNNWYWGVAVKNIQQFLKDKWGEELTPEEVHIFNLEYVQKGKPEIKEVMGEQVVIYKKKSSSQMTVKEFMEFKALLQVFWAEKGCFIPDPNEEDLLKEI